MGHTADFIGHIDVDPLNERERMYLEAFHGSRRFERGGDPDEIPGNPAAERWPEYLHRHFFSAEAPDQDSAFLDGFIFNHQLEGMVVGCRRDNKELFSIIAEDGRIFREVLRPADPRYPDYSPLRYGQVIGQDRAGRTRGSRRTRRGNVVAIRSRES